MLPVVVESLAGEIGVPMKEELKEAQEGDTDG